MRSICAGRGVTALGSLHVCIAIAFVAIHDSTIRFAIMWYGDYDCWPVINILITLSNPDDNYVRERASKLHGPRPRD